jgi:hypothetical protein
MNATEFAWAVLVAFTATVIAALLISAMKSGVRPLAIFGLRPIVRAVIAAWVWVYTAVVPKEHRDRRRREAASYLDDVYRAEENSKSIDWLRRLAIETIEDVPAQLTWMIAIAAGSPGGRRPIEFGSTYALRDGPVTVVFRVDFEGHPHVLRLLCQPPRKVGKRIPFEVDIRGMDGYLVRSYLHGWIPPTTARRRMVRRRIIPVTTEDLSSVPVPVDELRAKIIADAMEVPAFLRRQMRRSDSQYLRKRR